MISWIPIILWLFVEHVSGSQSCDALHNLLPFVQYKKRKKHLWRSDTVSYHSTMGVFHVFKIVQMAPHRTKHFIWKENWPSSISEQHDQKIVKVILWVSDQGYLFPSKFKTKPFSKSFSFILVILRKSSTRSQQD